MPYFESPVDSARLFYRSYAPDATALRRESTKQRALTLVFVHGWPMSSRMFDHLIVPLCETHQFRCVAVDRRGFGKSDWNNPLKPVSITWDTLVADLVHILAQLEVDDFVFVAASMGCTESLLAYQGSERIRNKCKGLIWAGAIMPYPVYSPEHPLGPTTELWDAILGGFRDNRPVFVAGALPGVFALEAGNEVHPKVLENFERIVAEADGLAIEKIVAIFNQGSEAEILKLAASEEKIPILVIHGDSDQSMPAEASAKIIKDMVPWAQLKVYEKAGHGLYLTHASEFVADILAFVESID